MADPERFKFIKEHKKEIAGGGLFTLGLLAESPLMALVGLGVAFFPDKKSS